MTLTAVSLFAGIGGIDLALERAGVRVVAAVEIDPAARGVLADHFPDVTLFEDVREVTGDQLRAAGFVPERGILAAGWPCTGNSVAGRRLGMDDPRSGLWRDVVRLLAETRARWFFGENVPGLYSVNGGRDIAIVRHDLSQLGYWWTERVLDAQHFGVPQRRRRVFFVGHLGGDGAAPVEVLFEPDGGGGDPAPRAAARPGTAPVAALSASDGGADDNDARGGRLVVGPLQAQGSGGRGHRLDAEGAATGHLLAGTVAAKWAKGTGGPAGDEAQNLLAFDLAQITHPENRVNPKPGDPAMPLAATGQPHIAYTLRADPGGVGQGNNTNYVPVAFDWKASGTSNGPNMGTGAASSVRTERQDAVAFIVDKERDLPNQEGITIRPTDVASTLTADGDPAEQKDRGLRIVTGTAVRRLTPTECERLMGLPDGWTATSYGKPQADSPRYRQLGNSVAVPVVEWIARRIVAVDAKERS